MIEINTSQTIKSPINLKHMLTIFSYQGNANPSYIDTVAVYKRTDKYWRRRGE